MRSRHTIFLTRARRGAAAPLFTGAVLRLEVLSSYVSGADILKGGGGIGNRRQSDEHDSHNGTPSLPKVKARVKSSEEGLPGAGCGGSPRNPNDLHEADVDLRTSGCCRTQVLG